VIKELNMSGKESESPSNVWMRE